MSGCPNACDIHWLSLTSRVTQRSFCTNTLTSGRVSRKEIIVYYYFLGRV